MCQGRPQGGNRLWAKQKQQPRLLKLSARDKREWRWWSDNCSENCRGPFAGFGYKTPVSLSILSTRSQPWGSQRVRRSTSILAVREEQGTLITVPRGGGEECLWYPQMRV